MKAFLGINYVMTVNQLPNIPMYWDCDHFIGISGIQNIFTRGKYQEILQNVHFADNSNTIKPTKTTIYALSLITWTNHSKKATRMSLSKALTSIWSSSRDVLQSDNIWKWNQLNGGFKWWLKCASSNGYLYGFDLYLGKKQNVEVNLGEGVVMQLSEKLRGTFCTLFFW